MALFFFDIVDHQGFTPAGDGLELADLDAATGEAKKAAAEMVGEAIRRDILGPIEIRIRTEGAAEAVMRLSWRVELPGAS